MKKRWVLLPLSFVLVLALLIGGLIIYIAPSKQLTMDYTPIKLEDKLLGMVRNLSTDLVLTESDINALLKANMNRQPHKQLTIEGAHFTLQDNILYADLNVLLADRVPAELHASYVVTWHDPELKLQPVGLKVKGLTLPVSWLNEITFPIYDADETLIVIDRLYTQGNELVIKLKLSLFR
ncbi:hypothetical protein J40TS1_35990 [Paenibacillus montaniterrae]|uniref:Uncharacterized protein n=1 Tax=Paenibacillus montaniterrae TaxID=429341 RepID=A0A919YNY6_9BACL|nr:hypothetical protein [Paenibacillus montaniterrae]GIP17957.1 hypothetical protein J40TS1_35990 [Paenibacillus montaniterrae]